MTALFEEALYDFVAKLPAVQNAAAGRVYPARAPDKTPCPFVVYTKISGGRDAVQDGNPGFAHPRLQLSVWSDNYKQAKQLALELVKALHGYRGPLGQGVTVAALVDNEVDLWDVESRLHHIAVDVKLWHTEET